MNISKRMECIISMVTPGYSVCDVGCDHAFISIALVKRRISPKALCMDINEGPLRGAKEHIDEEGLGELISVRLSDGLKKYVPGEADSLIIAGMGGPLLCDILSENINNTRDFKEMILSPQSEIADCRKYLYQNGFVIANENMVFDEGKFYVVMRVIKQEEVYGEGKCPMLTEREAMFGPCLIRERNPVLADYLSRESEKTENVLCKLKKTEITDDIKYRVGVLQAKKQMIDETLSFIRE